MRIIRILGVNIIEKTREKTSKEKKIQSIKNSSINNFVIDISDRRICSI